MGRGGPLVLSLFLVSLRQGFHFPYVPDEFVGDSENPPFNLFMDTRLIHSGMTMVEMLDKSFTRMLQAGNHSGRRKTCVT